MRLAPRTLYVGGAAASTVLFVLFAMIVPPGTPYDEPSHYATVEYYGTEHRLPVLGDPGVTYEAQFGPLYYGFAGVVHEAGSGLSSKATFYVTRLAGIIPWLFTLLLTYRLGKRLSGEWAGAAAVALIGLNPALLAVVSSVQNDALAIALCTWMLLLTAEAVERRTASRRFALLFGLLAGLAVLTKLHTGIVAAACLVAIVTSLRRDRGRTFVIVGACVAALTLWWFVRNVHLYGDLTGRSGIKDTGVEFPPSKLRLSTFRRYGRGVFAYLWTPAEYYRNLINTPRWYEGSSALLSIAAAVGFLRARGVTRAGVAMSGVAAALIASHIVIYVTESALGGRYLYLLCALYATALVRGFRGLNEAIGHALLGITLVLYVGYAIVVLADVHDARQFIFFS